MGASRWVSIERMPRRAAAGREGERPRRRGVFVESGGGVRTAVGMLIMSTVARAILVVVSAIVVLGARTVLIQVLPSDFNGRGNY